MDCHIAKVKQCDLVSCIKSITMLGANLLSVTRSNALAHEFGGIVLQPAYVVVYESHEEIGWETLC